MSVTAFRIKNFMGFEDSGWIELRPITLLFGRNSTGKSAIMRALLLLRQSLRSKAEYGPLLFVDENGYDLGSFEDLVRDHKLSHKMSFSFRLALQRPQEDRAGNYQQNIDAENMEAVLKGMRVIGSEDSRKHLVVELEFIYKFDKMEQRTKLHQFVLIDGTSGKYILNATAPHFTNTGDLGWKIKSTFFQDDLIFKRNRPSVWPEVVLHPQIGFLPNLITPEGSTEFFADSIFDPNRSSSDNSYESFKHFLAISFRHIRDFFMLFHLGPMRPEPQRFYYAAARSLGPNAGQGLSFVRSYLDAQADDVQLERLDTLQDWLIDTFGLEYKVEALDKKKRLFELTIQEVEGNHSSNIREVGFGISQLLPILIQTVISGQNTQLLIEQPELHLHPGAQAQLGDFFIQAARRGVHFLIETHSEHLLLRLRRRIAESTIGNYLNSNELYLRHTDIQAMFVDRNEEGKSSIEKVEIDQFGEMAGPSNFRGFFADDAREVALLAKARLQGQMQMEEEK